VGDDSRHPDWIDGDADFDLALIYYGSENKKYVDDSTYYKQGTGYKWNLIADFIDTHPKILKQYKRIWCPDDDIQANSYVINMLFRYFEYYDMNIAQPSLTKQSVYSHEITLHREEVILRYTNFVEIMMPLFSIPAFRKVFHTFRESVTCWGCDWVWPKLLEFENCGIIDAVVVTHGRKYGDIVGKYKKDHIFPEDELKYNLKKYGIASKICIELSNVRVSYPKKRCKIKIKGISNPKNFSRLSRPCRRANYCSIADDEVSGRFMDLRVLK
jgi:hypothetical protein